MATMLTRWIAPTGCAVVGITLVVIFVLQLGASLPWVVVGGIAVLWGADRLRQWRIRVLARQFREATDGRAALVVYTASPHWLPRIESEWMDKWGERAVFFNRSAPWSRNQPEARLWVAVAGVTEHTPLVVLVPRAGKPRVVRFFHAFREFKHGKEARLLRAEAEVDAALAAMDR